MSTVDPITCDAHSLNKLLEPYRAASDLRGWFELAVTALPLAALWGAAWWLYANGWWWVSLLIGVPSGGLLVRLFTIQHDCGHGAFFRHRLVNDWVGRVIGALTLTPYDFWKRAHAIHHTSSGNLDRRGVGDITTLTVDEYRSSSCMQRALYRLYRNPIVLFIVGPLYVFLLQQRLPVGFMRGGWRPWLSTQATNVAIAAIVAGLIWAAGLKAFLLVHAPIVVIAASIGVWLFYVQHQFEGTFWSDATSWSFHEAALQGSSYYDLPLVLRWFTANIGIHHVHHVSSRIPFYRLPRVLHDYPQLKSVGRVTLFQSLRCIRLTLWDEQRKRLVSFREARALSAA